MSNVAQLPLSAVRDYKTGSTLGGQSLAEPGQDFSASETWRILAEDTTAFLNVVYGQAELVGGYSGAAYRVVPLRHPEYPFALATGFSASTRGFNGNSLINGGKFWKYRYITVQFKTRPYQFTGQDAFLTKSGNPSSRQIPGPASGFLLNGSPPIFDPGEQIGGEQFTYTAHQLPSLDMATYDSVRDCLNATTFDGRPPGTVIYRGPGYSATSGIVTSPSWEIQHPFEYSKLPWNYAYMNGLVYEVFRADGVTPKYLSVDLTQVFG